ncbi:QueT transporter family protein [Dellaglioa algida]|uniref:QueT transporter family protein n=1 Tax=Dellaglioa algida TaxID=105612 RepID=UPI0024C490EC|nr:QueT transporter family protein [Dellaglioa algida]MDK1728641.1 QueT transporter family protein [Dellaglioa algida]MDK1736408.1 QueT transporter family protein [Dellaglioa algida]MDK1738142.1 QueT transporter family protein [Dellaglioa algida]
MTKNNRVNQVIINGLIAALYIVLAVVPGIFSMASGAIQFRLSEGLNHLVLFNKKYIWGVSLGVILFNLFYSSPLDVLFGGAQTIMGLLIVIFVSPRFKEMWQKMLLNIVVFSFTMFLIAIMLNMTANLPFWPTYGTTALSEFVIMTITAPLMIVLDRAIHFDKRMY